MLCSCDVTKLKIEEMWYIIKFVKDVRSPYTIKSVFFTNFYIYPRYCVVFCAGDTESKHRSRFCLLVV